MLVNLTSILKIAEEKKFAVPAFNVYNTETVMGVFAAAQEAHAPVIMQIYSRLFTTGVAAFLAPSVLAAAQEAAVPVCFHLDHGAGEPEVQKALRYGCTGIMFDHSSYAFEENLAATKRIVALCSAVGVPVEGELGHIGSANEETLYEMTDVSEAELFAADSGVVAMAVQVGTAHGRYKKAPQIDVERIAAIHARSNVALVLHGGSGIPDDQIRQAIGAGVRKVNFGTDVCYSFLDSVFAVSRDKVAVDVFMHEPVESVRDFALSKIELLGAKGKG